MRSTMLDEPLLISSILRRGQQVFGNSEIVTLRPDGYHTATFEQVGSRAEQLAKALARLGVGDGDRVGTFMWNDQEHMEAYLAVPSMGSVLHTLNLRLFPEQLAYVVNHAEDRVVIVDDSVAPLFERVRAECPSIEHVVVVGDREAAGIPGALAYEELLSAEEAGFDWPRLDERDAAAMCYTSGTTGNPKGVAYSHRSTWLHSMAGTAAFGIGVAETDRALVIVPMFHANAWGMPYVAFLAGADLVMPERFLQAEPLSKMFREQRPTLSLGVPTIWNDLLRYSETNDVDMSSVRLLTAGGAAVPRALMEAYEERFGVKMLQGWGMTETSPVATVARAPKGTPTDEEMEWRAKAGRLLPGVEVRVVDSDDTVLPADGKAIGEFEIRGPWVTGSYYGDPSAERFHDGWLRTGDVGTLDGRGCMTISDRTKDVIKSGGEWISSVELENEVMAHPGVFEAAVVGVPDARWDERPLVVVVAGQADRPDPKELIGFLSDRVARWWLPERWAFVEELPKTSVGKFDKKVIRAQVADGEIDVVSVELPPQRT
jgi:fatty-acyl-CoA synthase